MSGKRWGQAWIEVLANRPLVLQRLGEGYAVRRIYQELLDQKLLTVAPSNFYTAVDKLKKREASTSAIARPPAISAPPSPESRTTAPAPRAADDTRIPRFVHDSSSGDFQLTPIVEPCAGGNAQTQGSKPNHED